MRVGVTGIFASGKGTVCAMLGKLGAVVIDTDIIAREIVEPGGEGLGAIVEEFGSSFLNEDGSLNRREFANLVFGDEEKVKRLNGITHPLIGKRTMELSSGDEIYVINVPLLFETGLNREMHCSVVVFAERGQVLERGSRRDNITENEIASRLEHQIPLNEKKKMADYLIDNSGSLENTERQVVELWNTLKAMKER